MSKRPIPRSVLVKVAGHREARAAELADIDPVYAQLLRESAATLRDVAGRV